MWNVLRPQVCSPSVLPPRRALLATDRFSHDCLFPACLALQLGVPSSRICPRPFRACGPSEPSEHRRDRSMPLMRIRTCTQVERLLMMEWHWGKDHTVISKRSFPILNPRFFLNLLPPCRGLVFVPDDLPLVCISTRQHLLCIYHFSIIWLHPVSKWWETQAFIVVNQLMSAFSQWFAHLSGLEAGEVGLVLTYAVTLVGNLQWTMRQSAEVENMVRNEGYFYQMARTYRGGS